MLPINRGDRGDSLIEILVAVAVLGIAVTALMFGLGTNATTTISNRSQSKAATILQDAAEYVKALSGGTCSPNSSTTITNTDVPHDSAFTVTYGPATDFNGSTSCNVMAKVPVTVTGDGYTLTLTVVRRG